MDAQLAELSDKAMETKKGVVRRLRAQVANTESEPIPSEVSEVRWSAERSSMKGAFLRKLRRKAELTAADDEADRRGQKDYVSARAGKSGQRVQRKPSSTLPSAIFTRSPGLSRIILRQ